MKVAVVGAGSWGTTVASLVCANADVVLWARRPELAAAIDRDHLNPDYLPDYPLADRLRATPDLAEAVGGAEVVVMGVPSHGFRAVLEEAAPHVAGEAAVISLTKGIEQGSDKRMTEVVAEVLAGHPPERVGVLSGPNLAKEVIAGQPTATVVAVPDPGLAARLQAVFMTPTLRVYTNDDVVGCEMAGALKNVMAIGSGIAAGLGYGTNAMAALITRALAELSRLGRALGGDPLTFAGLAGMGDLIATCVSPLSRNRTVGFELGRGRELAAIVEEMNMVAEGVKTTPVVVDLARRAGVEMPIADQVAAVLEGQPVAEMVPNLMLREAKPERYE